jgi:hypothetical protein
MTLAEYQLAEIRKILMELPEKHLIRVQAIAVTLRNILSTGDHAHVAYWLVCAEEAARDAEGVNGRLRIAISNLRDVGIGGTLT